MIKVNLCEQSLNGFEAQLSVIGRNRSEMQCRCENVNSVPSQRSHQEEFTPSGCHGDERMLSI